MSSFGEELKRERELREISLREISEATKISLRYLECLERNDFEHLPGGVFNKGFVRAYSQYIGVDPESMVNAYLLEAKGQQLPGGEKLSSDLFRPAAGGDTRLAIEDDGAGRDRRSLWGIVLIGALVIVIAASVLTWRLWWVNRDAESDRPRPAVQEEIPPPATGLEPGSSEPEDAAARPTADHEGDSNLAAAGAVAPVVETPRESETRRGPAETEATAAGSSEIRVVIRRPTQGRLNCDNRRVEILDGLTGGTELVFRCREFLLVDARDGGALVVRRGRDEPESLGPDGVPVKNRRVDPPSPADAEEPS